MADIHTGLHALTDLLQHAPEALQLHVGRRGVCCRLQARLAGAEHAELVADIHTGLHALTDLLQHAPEALQLHVGRRGVCCRLQAGLAGAEHAELVADIHPGLHALADLLQHAPEALQLHVGDLHRTLRHFRTGGKRQETSADVTDDAAESLSLLAAEQVTDNASGRTAEDGAEDPLRVQLAVVFELLLSSSHDQSLLMKCLTREQYALPTGIRDRYARLCERRKLRPGS